VGMPGRRLSLPSNNADNSLRVEGSREWIEGLEQESNLYLEAELSSATRSHRSLARTPHFLFMGWYAQMMKCGRDGLLCQRGRGETEHQENVPSPYQSKRPQPTHCPGAGKSMRTRECLMGKEESSCHDEGYVGRCCQQLSRCAVRCEREGAQEKEMKRCVDLGARGKTNAGNISVHTRRW